MRDGGPAQTPGQWTPRTESIFPRWPQPHLPFPCSSRTFFNSPSFESGWDCESLTAKKRRGGDATQVLRWCSFWLVGGPSATTLWGSSGALVSGPRRGPSWQPASTTRHVREQTLRYSGPQLPHHPHPPSLPSGSSREAVPPVPFPNLWARWSGHWLHQVVRSGRWTAMMAVTAPPVCIACIRAGVSPEHTHMRMDMMSRGGARLVPVSKSFSKVRVPVYTPWSSEWGFPWLPASSTVAMIRPFQGSDPRPQSPLKSEQDRRKWCKRVSQTWPWVAVC